MNRFPSMNRRDFLLVSSGLASGAFWAPLARAQSSGALVADPTAQLRGYFDLILAGFLRHAHAASPDYTACNFPDGTVIKGCCTPSGKSYTSVARMLPALAEYAAADLPRVAGTPDLGEVLLSIYRTAFDPKHPDYWGEPTGNKPTQRTVESSLVAIALARMGPGFVARLTAEQRANVNRWLASCTVVPERTNNHAWFTALNQAARLKLSRTFREFKGDETWMIDDLKAMDVLAANAADGWYSDDPKLTVYDYYNFWTFGNFPLFWSRIAGDLYPEWNAKLQARGREFLQHVPYFFAADGGVPLFGRSLLYRWALLSPLILGYQQGIWPHTPGLLRRILRKNFAWWWDMGAFDEQLGKLRERLAPEGTAEVTEAYIDNGHPYWAMQAFTFFSIPASDPLWTSPEEELPVERADYAVRIPGPKMILTGTKSSGQVRWLQAKNQPRRDYYRDKYNKFTWSSSFPFNVLQDSKDFCPWDQALVFRDATTGVCAARIFCDDGELLDDGVRTTWTTTVNGRKARVVSTIRLAGDFEFRRHAVAFESAGATESSTAPRVAGEALEGSYPLGLLEGEEAERRTGPTWMAIRSTRSGNLLVSWRVAGHETIRVAHDFDPKKRTRVNLVHPRTAVLSLSKRLDLSTGGTFTLTSLHYASPKPAEMEQIQAQAEKLLRQWS
jgi:hypothetical protein